MPLNQIFYFGDQIAQSSQLVRSVNFFHGHEKKLCYYILARLRAPIPL